MPVSSVAAPTFPAVVSDVMKAAVETTFASICGAKPKYLGNAASPKTGDSMIATISFVGDVAWAFNLILPQATAVALAQKFAGFEIPFESPDMGDAVGELANVLAGSVVAGLESRRVKAKLSLPSVTRGTDVELLPPRDAPASVLSFESPQGALWFKLVSAKPG